VVLDRHRFERLGDSDHQQLHVAVVIVIVHYHRPGEPVQVTLVRRLTRLLRAQRWIVLGQLTKPADDEVELYNQRLLGPQRAVIVEDGKPSGGFNVVGPPCSVASATKSVIADLVGPSFQELSFALILMTLIVSRR
jgi:hypothetical protein